MMIKYLIKLLYNTKFIEVENYLWTTCNLGASKPEEPGRDFTEMESLKISDSLRKLRLPTEIDINDLTGIKSFREHEHGVRYFDNGLIFPDGDYRLESPLTLYNSTTIFCMDICDPACGYIRLILPKNLIYGG